MMAFDNQKELLGKKTNKGFYLHQSDKSKEKPKYNSQIDEIINLAQSKNKNNLVNFTSDEIVERCMLVMINESAKCLEEEVVKNANYLDMAMIMGAGFPAFRGGILRYADKIGISSIVEKLQKLENQFGSRYKVSDLLVRMANLQQKFYS